RGAGRARAPGRARGGSHRSDPVGARQRAGGARRSRHGRSRVARLQERACAGARPAGPAHVARGRVRSLPFELATRRGPAARCDGYGPGRTHPGEEEVVMTTAAPEAVRSQRGTTLVDLSLEITNGMPAHSFFPSPVWLPYVTHAESVSAGLGEP